MPYCLVGFGRSIALSLGSQRVKQDRTAQVFELDQGLYHLLDIVTVYRTEISESHRFEKVAAAMPHQR